MSRNAIELIIRILGGSGYKTRKVNNAQTYSVGSNRACVSARRLKYVYQIG